MAKSVKSKFDKRVVFPSGKQSHFLLTARQNSKLSWSQLTERIGVHKRTLNDWRREKYSLPFNVLKKISKLTRSKIPENIDIKDPFWYVNKGAKIGGVACIKKYGRVGGDPEYRKKKWYEWWERKGKFIDRGKFFKRKPIKKPVFSEDVAEFTGIVLGDGGITKRQVTFTFHSEDDREYADFVVGLAKKLFDVYIGTCHDKYHKAVKYYISRTELVRFCVEKLGLKLGNKLKQGLDIPSWIQKKLEFQKACIRGLIDTDGCFFNECHKINEKRYCYPRLAFTSYSKQLRSSVFKILRELNFSPKIRSKRNVQLENRDDIIKYFNLIGTSNLKHKRKFEIAFGEGSGVVVPDGLENH